MVNMSGPALGLQERTPSCLERKADWAIKRLAEVLNR